MASRPETTHNEVSGQATSGPVVQANTITGGVHHGRTQHAHASGEAEIRQAGRDQYHIGGGLHLHTEVSPQQIRDAISQITAAVVDVLQQQGVLTPALPPGHSADTDIRLYVDELLNGLDLGDHDEAERRVSRLFIPLLRAHQRAAVEALIQLAMTIEDHATQLIACTLVEAADRLDPTLISIDDVERMARSNRNSLRTSAAVLLWQWASSIPGRVPIPLLARLTQPSTETNWYVHAPARAGAQQLLLARGSARAIFDRMVSSHDRDDRAYAAEDLLEVAHVEPRAVPVGLARMLARDRDETIAARGAELLEAVQAVDDAEREKYQRPFGL